MTIPDPRDALFDAIDIEKVHIDRFHGFVFLCVGPRLNSTKSPGSAREHIYNFLLVNDTGMFDRIRWAEDIKDWFDPSELYSNLIDFENDVAELADAVVIFVESAGSIAEFAAFCQIPSIAPKLLIFVQEAYAGDGSFIDLGPAKFLRADNKKSVSIYPWTFNKKGFVRKSIEGSEKEIVDDIKQHLSSVGNSVKFDRESLRHKILLVCDVLDQCSALTQSELRDYLSRVGVDIETQALKRLLFILEKFEYLAVVHRGNYTYYVTKQSPSTITYSFSKATEIAPDAQRRKTDILEYYEKNPKESRRFKAIMQERKRAGEQL